MPKLILTLFGAKTKVKMLPNLRAGGGALSKIKGAFSEIPSVIVSIAQQQQRQQRKVLTMHRNHKNTIKAGGSTATKMWTGWVMGDG